MICAFFENSALENVFTQYCQRWDIPFNIKKIPASKQVQGLYLSDSSFSHIDLKRFLNQAKNFSQARAKTIKNDTWENLGIYYTQELTLISELQKTINFVATPTYREELKKAELRPALFLDRDGILNHDHAYVYKKEDFVFYPDVVELIVWARKNNYWVFVLTNQSGIGKGLYTEKDFWDFNALILSELRKHQVSIDQIYFSPFHEEASDPIYRRHSLTRKPAPGMLFAAAFDYPIDLNCSVMVGDKKSDILDFPGVRYFVKRSQYTDGKNLPSAAIAVNNLHELLEHLK